MEVPCGARCFVGGHVKQGALASAKLAVPIAMRLVSGCNNDWK